MEQLGIFDGGKTLTQNELYYYRMNTKVPSSYMYNYLQFKTIPTIEQLEDALQQTKKHRLNEAIVIRFPLSQSLSAELITYFKEHGFALEQELLLELKPTNFKVQYNDTIDVAAIGDEQFKDYYQFEYNGNIRHGEKFATEITNYLQFIYKQGVLKPIVAWKDNQIVGALRLFIHPQTNSVEIDNFYVVDAFQKQGVGTALQSFIVEQFPNSKIRLVADVNDTPQEMYQKQGYQIIGNMYYTQKIVAE